MADSIGLLRAWVIETLGALADDDDHTARLRRTLGENHLQLELALLASEWLCPAVLRRAGTPPQ